MSRVVTGLQRLMAEGPSAAGLAPGARIAVVAHPASVDGDGRHAVELLARHGELRLVRLFAPEHGLFGQEQDMEHVDHTTDPGTGLPVRSLYGSTAESLRPRAEDLQGLDAIVYDLQDVGSRYYTFVYTLSLIMEASRDADVRVVVLDRPNPIGGTDVEGPVLDPSLASFVGRFPLPVRHGMTTAELARMFQHRFGLGCDLRVVPMRGWRRDMAFEATGLPWVPPSPNMPTVRTALVYPGGCLIEGTNLSEGRGTTTPFELAGAPWIDGHALADVLRDEALEGVIFRAARFRPAFQKHAGQACGGVQVIPTDRARFRPFRTYLALLRHAGALSGESFGWRTEAYEFETDRLAIDLLLGRREIRHLLEEGASLETIERTWTDDAAAFAAERERWLIYS